MRRASRRSVVAAMAVLLVPMAIAADEPAAPVPPKLPPGVSATLYEISVPERLALGAQLFSDKRLSVDDSVSCETCHDPKRGFVDHKALSDGVKGGKTM